MADDSIYQTRAPGPGPLHGLKVLDLTQARAGPTCSRALGHMGADVTQVWPPGKADVTGSDYANLHHGKRSLMVDLRTDAGREILHKLLANTDVLVENFRTPVKHKLGIAPETLLAHYPRLIYASISGFGQDGPDAARPGVDPIAQGYGLMSITGQPEVGPTRVGIAITDTGSGMFLTQGVLAALYARERTGRGQWVHTSLLETMVAMLDFQATKYLIDGVVPGLVGNSHPSFFPFGTFRTRDGWINVGSTNFKLFCDLLDLQGLADDPRYDTGGNRVKYRAELTKVIEAALAQRDTSEWITLLGPHMPCGPVLSMDGLFADEQVRHLNVTRSIPHPDGRMVDVLRYPVTFSEQPTEIIGGVVSAGAQTREILGELGYSDAQIDALFADATVANKTDSKGW